MALVLRWWFGIILSNLNLFLTVHSSVSMKLVIVSSNVEVGLGSGLVVRSNVSNMFSYMNGVLGCNVVKMGLQCCHILVAKGQRANMWREVSS